MTRSARQDEAPPPAPPPDEAAAELTVVAYHERTKHHFHRYAASSPRMDWATQPNPFRRFDGAPLLPLPLPAEGRSLPYWQLYVPGVVAPAPLEAGSLSLFLRLALSLTAWKSFQGTRWALRANPSSGNLHPTEGYLLLPPLNGVLDRAALHHYAPQEHGLECRAEFDPAAGAALAQALPAGGFLVGLTSIHWREAWKYGERAFRYSQLDTGHALGALRLAAAALGWGLRLAGDGAGLGPRLLGLDRDADFAGAEREDFELLAWVGPRVDTCPSLGGLPPPSIWQGRANRLSPRHTFDWPVIDEVAAASAPMRAAGDEDACGFPAEEALFDPPVREGRLSAERAILGRRSAVAMDGATPIPAAAFFRMLARLVPQGDRSAPPWDALSWRPRIHLGLFVHRVEGIEPGLYALVRDPSQTARLRSAMRPGLRWQRPPGCPPGLDLYLLEAGDCRAKAATVACRQEIAGDGAFSVAMLADYLQSIAARGAGFYRHLFWEAGLVGQLLYLEAEEAGVRGTGIGCFFDDPVHEVFGLASRDWQCFYAFTVGAPVEDTRLSTLPAYPAPPQA
ncbi:SagB/ThcOx family dehydrogenase [Caldimonas tepidiphila]|uniref:SagB/ThcOx family dehydrogenase n=1 Tax=Caldimonas tepidiphila TaxID=2315841 RepID=UPI000E5A6A3A|nr:SagB/ThcOx family dehydrogenase [Caldimonas tepidiphila]